MDGEGNEMGLDGMDGGDGEKAQYSGLHMIIHHKPGSAHMMDEEIKY